MRKERMFFGEEVISVTLGAQASCLLTPGVQASCLLGQSQQAGSLLSQSQQAGSLLSQSAPSKLLIPILPSAGKDLTHNNIVRCT